ncbi:MAG: hypothetical protein HS128_09725 [Ideonella sp.]|nr:hypothetical protein [Ideonella sp.]
MTRFPILIEDDFELYGNGLGDVASLQYLPTMAFLNMLDDAGVRVTFMVDVAQHLFLTSQRKHDRHVAQQCDLWEHTVRSIAERGHDVQLHLHPQWLGASRRGGFNLLDKRWNIGLYAPEQQRQLVTHAVAYLRSLLKVVIEGYRVVAYKAGSWGMQPSRVLFETLADEGIKIVIGAREGMHIPANQVDFRGMEEASLPYHPDFDDLRKVSERPNGITVIPMAAYAPDWPALVSLAVAKVRSRLVRTRVEERFYHRGEIPQEVLSLSPLEGRQQLKLAYRPYLTHLKLGDVPYTYLMRSLRAVIGRLRRLDRPLVPLVIESHTKQFKGHYSDIARFLRDLKPEFGDEVEFMTISRLATILDQNPTLVRARAAAA